MDFPIHRHNNKGLHERHMDDAIRNCMVNIDREYPIQNSGEFLTHHTSNHHKKDHSRDRKKDRRHMDAHRM